MLCRFRLRSVAALHGAQVTSTYSIPPPVHFSVVQQRLGGVAKLARNLSPTLEEFMTAFQRQSMP